MFACCTKWYSVLNSIYSGQKLFSYKTGKKILLPIFNRKLWLLLTFAELPPVGLMSCFASAHCSIADSTAFHF